MIAVGIIVISVRIIAAPTSCIVITGFQTALLRWFPFVVGFDVDAAIFVTGRLALIIRRFCRKTLCLTVVQVLIPTELVVRTAHLQLMIVLLEGIIQGGISARMTTNARLIALKVACCVAGFVRKQVCTGVGVSVIEHLRVAYHAESRDADGVTLRYMEIESGTSEHSTALVFLDTLLLQMAFNQGAIQFLATCSGEVITVSFATTITGVIAVTDVEIAVHNTGVEIDIKAHVSTRRGIPRLGKRVVDTGLYGTVITCGTIFLHDQIDDTRCSFGAVFGRGIGDQLDLLDRSGRHLLEYLSAVLGIESSRFAVDPDLYIFGVTQGDVSFLIDIHGRDVLQDLRDAGSCRSDILIYGEYFLVQFKTHGAALRHHFYVLKRLCIFFERNTSHVHRHSGNFDGLALLAVTHK